LHDQEHCGKDSLFRHQRFDYEFIMKLSSFGKTCPQLLCYYSMVLERNGVEFASVLGSNIRPCEGVVAIWNVGKGQNEVKITPSKN
jgi:hypothetical protein